MARHQGGAALLPRRAALDTPEDPVEISDLVLELKLDADGEHAPAAVVTVLACGKLNETPDIKQRSHPSDDELLLLHHRAPAVGARVGRSDRSAQEQSRADPNWCHLKHLFGDTPSEETRD